MNNSIIVIPTYNEVGNIERIIPAVLAQDVTFHVLVVDDGSPDGTGGVVKDLMTQFPDKVFLIEREGKQGLGTAYIAGFKWALEQEYEFIFEMDADFSHDPKDLALLKAACENENAHMSIGSRYVKGVNVVNWPLGRILLSMGASKYVQFITGMGIDDATAGFVCYKRELLQKFNFDEIQFTGYAFQIEMKFKAYLLESKIMEVPVIFTDRSVGNSKMTSGIINEAIFGVPKMKFKSLMGKLKI